MNSKHLLFLFTALLLFFSLEAQEFDKDKLRFSEQQSLIRTLQRQKNQHKPKGARHFFMPWKYAGVMDDDQLMKGFRLPY